MQQSAAQFKNTVFKMFTLFYTPQASTSEAPFYQHSSGGLLVQVRPPAYTELSLSLKSSRNAGFFVRKIERFMKAMKNIKLVLLKFHIADFVCCKKPAF